MPRSRDSHEVRHDPFGRFAVLVAPSRAARPSDFEWPKPIRREGPCPFCPGNEHLTTPAVLESPSTGPWKVRVVPNKYPALSADPAEPGGHEVVIETDQHEADFFDRPPEDNELLVRAWASRLAYWQTQPGIEHCTIVRNVGHRAGGTLAHPHSQLFAIPVTPASTVSRMEREKEHWRREGRPLIESLTDCAAAQDRVVLSTKSFTTFVPYAARQPFELMTAASDSLATAADFNEAQITDLAKHLRHVQSALSQATSKAAYNLWFEEAPLSMISPTESSEIAPDKDTLDVEANRAAHRWCMGWMPRRSTTGGFEWATGCYINALPPERAAGELRKHLHLR